jgi:PAS domain S-box-containing protein
MASTDSAAATWALQLAGFDELRTRYDRQEAIAALSRAAIGAEALGPLLAQAIESAVETLGVDVGLIAELSSDRSELLLRAGHGFTLPAADVSAPLAGSALEELIRSRCPLLFDAPEPSLRFGERTVAQGVRAGFGVLIPGPQQPWGAIAVYSTVRRQFGCGEVEFLVSMANVLGLVIARDGLAAERRRQAEMTVSILDNIPVMMSVCDEAGRFLHVNREWQETLGWTLEEVRERNIFADLYPDPGAYAEVMEFFLRSDRQWTLFDARARDGRTVPSSWIRFRVSDGSSIGLGIDVSEQQQAANERERLIEKIREGRERQRALSRRLLTAQEEERRRLAVELHDELGQVLTAVKISLESLHRASGGRRRVPPTLEGTIRSVDDALLRVRDIALDLRPSVLDDLGLPAALRWYADRLAQSAGFEARVSIDEVADLDTGLATVCFRVAQEALTNVARHAFARNVWIDLHRFPDALELSVRDDGVGFDIAAARERAISGESIGLLGMQERVGLAGGEYEIANVPAGGVEVRARFPVAGSRASS